jgi:hypothetical protein
VIDEMKHIRNKNSLDSFDYANQAQALTISEAYGRSPSQRSPDSAHFNKNETSAYKERMKKFMMNPAGL